jgi:hypothetical protein
MGVYSIAAGGGLKKPRTIYPNMGINSPYIYGAMVPIASVTVTGSTTNVIAFGSIPQTFQDLVIVFNGRRTESVASSNLFMVFNATTSSYSNTILEGDGSSATSSRNTGAGALWLGYVPGASATSGIFGSVKIDVLNYTSSANKTTLTRYSSDLNGSGYTGLRAGLWSNTSAITALEFSTFSGSNYFAVGTTATLYGIRTANL